MKITPMKSSGGPGEPFNPSDRDYYPPGEPWHNGEGARATPPRIIKPTFWIPRDPATMPRRECLYGGHYYRKFLSTTAGQGGRGKTSLALVEAIAMAIQRPLLGVLVPKRLRVWYWNGEDPREEVERRILAICKHFKIDQVELAKWLCIDSGRETPIRIADQQGNKTVFGPDGQALTKALKVDEIDVLVLDPFVKTHGVPENDNGAIDRVARQFAETADEANCVIELPCHVRKASGAARSEITVDDLRGAGSLVDAARANRVINVMTAEEATAAQVKPAQRKHYFRVDTGKANMTPPAEAATWFKIISVPLDNGPAPGIDGDSVGVVISWQLPGVFAGIQAGDLARVQAKIDGGNWGERPKVEGLGRLCDRGSARR
jgi:hypothetical protein